MKPEEYIIDECSGIKVKNRDYEMWQQGIREVVEKVLDIIANPERLNYRLKEITEYCESLMRDNE